MSSPQQKINNQKKLARLEIVSQLYKRGFTVRKIQAEVIKRLDCHSYSTSTVHSDIQTLLKEWRDSRIDDVDTALQLELERIDDTIVELWDQWEKSKKDYTKTASKRKGAPVKDKKTGSSALKTFEKEETETSMICLGDTSYITEIRKQLEERRKLLGLYAPEKRELTGKDGKDLITEPILVEIIDSRDKVDAKDTDD